MGQDRALIRAGSPPVWHWVGARLAAGSAKVRSWLDGG